MIRVLRLWRWRDILRRTRPTRVYPYCARHVSRTYRLSVVCTPREPVISCAITCLVDQRWENPYDQRIRFQIQYSIRF